MAAFVLFCTPEAPGCAKVTPAWNKLGALYASDDAPGQLLVGTVDCSRGVALCASQHVTSVPTMMAFGPGSTYGEVYLGPINAKGLKQYALVLSDECDARSPQSCSESGRALIQPFLEMSMRQLEGKVSELQRMFDSTRQTRDEHAQKANAAEATEEEARSFAARASRADGMLMTLQKKSGTKWRRMKAVLEARGGTLPTSSVATAAKPKKARKKVKATQAAEKDEV